MRIPTIAPRSRDPIAEPEKNSRSQTQTHQLQNRSRTDRRPTVGSRSRAPIARSLAPQTLGPRRSQVLDDGVERLAALQGHGLQQAAVRPSPAQDDGERTQAEARAPYRPAHPLRQFEVPVASDHLAIVQALKALRAGHRLVQEIAERHLEH
eukprot:11166968-Lingulodinium_polyedra.AAC.1